MGKKEIGKFESYKVKKLPPFQFPPGYRGENNLTPPLSPLLCRGEDEVASSLRFLAMTRERQLTAGSHPDISGQDPAEHEGGSP